MSRGLSTPEMLHCTDMTVLERQRARMKWQQQGEDESYFSELSGVFSLPGQQVAVHGGFNGGFMGAAVKPDPAGFENGWLDPCGFGFGGACGSSFEANYGISRTYSCPPAVAAEAKGKEATIAAAVLNEKVKLISGAASKESFKKRKAEKIQNSKVASEDESKGKKMKENIKEGYSNSKITHQNNSKSNRNNNKKKESSEDSSKVTEVQKPDYIHVRARRGQATDSHSLAERVRREKISERMKYLQDLVPGCNKITGKAGMLDEIINYVQSLQRQVEFLSMKLATVNPRLDFNIEDLFAKEVFSSCPMNFPTIMNGMSSSEMLTNPINYAQFSNVQQEVVPCSGLEMGMINPPDMALRRTISAPVSIPETYVDSSCFTQLQSSVSAWDIDVQNYYNNINMTSLDQARLTPATTTAATTTFTSHQPFAGSVEVNNLKMEM